MAKKAKVNLTVNGTEGNFSFEKGKVYPDSAITSEVDASNFEDVSDEALEEVASTDIETTDSDVSEDEAPKKSKRTKKVAGEELE